MGHIGHEFLPLIFALLQRGGHIIKCQSQILDLIGTFGIYLNTGIQIAVTEVIGGLCHCPQRLALIAGEQGHHHHGQNNNQHRHQQIRIGDLLEDMVDLLHGSGHNDDAYTVTQAVGNGHSGHKPLFFI